MLADTHTHTSLCKHATGLPGEYLRAASNAGLGYLGVSDHYPWPDGFDAKWRMNVREYPEYSRMVADLKKTALLHGVEVLYGTEIDFVPGRMKEVWDNLAKESFDYIIGSVHYIDDFPMDSPEELHRWNEAGGPEKIWLSYAEHLLAFVKDGGFDIIGHCDLPKKFALCPPDQTPFKRKMNEVFEAAAANDIAIELNTAGLRKAAKEIYPSIDLLKAAKKAGVAICFGSDAHAPWEVGYAFKEAVELAKSAGYKTWTLVKERKRLEMPLP